MLGWLLVRESALRRQLDLLRVAPSFRLLFLATLGSSVGTWLATVALTVDVFDRTQSGQWVSALLIVEFLPAIAIGLFLGPLLDRLSRRRLMVVSDLLRCAVFCALPFAQGAAEIVVLAAVAGFGTSFFRPAVYAGLPNLVEDSDLPNANSLLQAIENLAMTGGPVLGGVILALSSPDVTYWVNAATFVFSAVLVASIPARRLQAEAPLSEGHWRDLDEGLRLVRRSRALLTVLVAWNVVVFANGGINVAEVKLAKVSFGAGDFGFALLIAMSGVGLVLGSLFAGAWVDRRGIARGYGSAIALMALGTAAAAVSPNVWIAAACLVVAGAGNATAIVSNALFVQRGAPDRLRGRAFTLLMSSNFAFLGLGMILAGRLTDAVGARWVWGGAAALFALASVVALVLARGIDEGKTVVDARAPAPSSMEPAARSTERAL